MLASLGVLIHMQRLIARLLLLFALAGTFIPLALAAAAPPPHACCVRKAAHQCHGSVPESDQLAICASGCCNRDCRRAVITSQYASPQPRATAAFLQKLGGGIANPSDSISFTQFSASQSTRAPPSIATT